MQLYDLKYDKSLGYVCSTECCSSLLLKKYSSQKLWLSRYKEVKSKEVKAKEGNVLFFENLETDEWKTFFGVDEEYIVNLSESFEIISEVLDNKSCLMMYHLWIKHKPVNPLLNKIFGISNSHRENILNRLIDICFEYCRERDHSPLKFPSKKERFKHCSILVDPISQEEVKITVIIDGTEQPYKK